MASLPLALVATLLIVFFSFTSTAGILSYTSTQTNQNDSTDQTICAYPDNISLRIEIPDLVFTPTVNGTLVEIPTCQNQTLSKTVIVALPPTMEVAGYNYQITTNRTFRFIQPLLSRQPESMSYSSVNSSKYAIVNPSEKLLQVLPYSFLRCYKIVPVSVYPLITREDSNEITLIKSVNITLSLKESTVKTVPATNDDLIEPIAEDIIYNYEEARRWKVYPVLTVNCTVSNPAAETGTYDYIIVTHNKFLDYANKLATWKNQKGVRTTVTTVQTIVTQFAGRDNATRIREYVKSAFNAYHFKFLLLFGDVSYVPTRYIYNPDYNTILEKIYDPKEVRDHKPTDLYYADLDVPNDWYDPEFNDYGRSPITSSSRLDLFGWTPDIVVGRIPVNTLNEANATITKQIMYEQARPPGEWSRRMLLVGARYEEGSYGSVECEEMSRLASPNTIFRKYYYELNNLLSFKKDFSVGSTIVYSGSHGSPTMLFQSDSEVLAWPALGLGGFFDSLEAFSSVSNGLQLPVWFSESCLSAAFDYSEKASFLEKLQYGFSDSIGEAILHNPRGGAIAFVGAARVTYRNGFDTFFFKCFFDSKKGDFSPGLSLYYTRLKASVIFSGSTAESIRKTFSTFHLLGDPEFKNRVASTISVSCSQQNVVIGKNTVVSGSISPAHDNMAVKLTYVRQNGSNVSRTVRTTSSGSYSDSFSPDKAGNWKVSASWDGDIDHDDSTSSASSFTVLATLTVQTPYGGIWIKVDGSSYTSDAGGRIQTTVMAGSHVIEVQPQIQMNAGTRSVFTRWSDGDLSNPRTKAVDADVTLTANYKTQFCLTVSTNPSGLASISGGGWYDSGASVSLYAPEVSGYNFTKWLVNNLYVAANPIDIVMDAPHIAVAHYQQAFTITFETVPMNTGAITFEGNSYSDGATVSVNAGTYGLVADIASSYTFTRWETVGGISVTDPNSPSTTCTVSGSGTLKMVQTATPTPTPSPTPSPSPPQTQSSAQFTLELSGQADAIFTYTGQDFDHVYSMYTSAGETVFRANIGGVAQQFGRTVEWVYIVVNVNQPEKVMTVSFPINSFAQKVDAMNWKIILTASKSVYPVWSKVDDTYIFLSPVKPQLPMPESATVNLPVNAVNAQFDPNNYIITYQLTTSTPSPTPPPRQACIIATAAYGSEMAPEVAYMRHVRDNMIGSNDVGRILVNGWNAFYYLWSPTVAETIGKSDSMQVAFRILLLPLIAAVHSTAFVYIMLATIDPILASVIAFLFAAILSTALYIVVPVMTIRAIYKKRYSVNRLI